MWVMEDGEIKEVGFEGEEREDCVMGKVEM